MVGNAPLAFTNSLGEQQVVPLSAFQFSGSAIVLATTPVNWSAQFGAADTAILLALAQARAATGDLSTPPVIPPVPALAFTAAVAGPQSNNIYVQIKSVSTTSTVTAEIVIDASETDTYPALASATAAANAIGVDVAPTATTDPPLGTGVVVVKSGSATGTGLPKTGQSLTVSGATNVLAADGTSTLFTLEPRSGYSGSGIPVTVEVDPSAATFTVTATYDAGNTTPVTAATLSSLPAPVGFLVKATAPPAGLALPAVTAAPGLALSGGAIGLPATGTAYTA